jgi:hypothetical protein
MKPIKSMRCARGEGGDRCQCQRWQRIAESGRLRHGLAAWTMGMALVRPLEADLARVVPGERAQKANARQPKFIDTFL